VFLSHVAKYPQPYGVPAPDRFQQHVVVPADFGSEIIKARNERTVIVHGRFLQIVARRLHSHPGWYPLEI
jgi:hypothetical protein